MVVLDGPAGAAEAPYRFAIATKEVTLAEFRRYAPAHENHHRDDPDCPADSVSWDAAAAYCNLLSERERIPPSQWCYERTAPAGRLVPRPEMLALTGYRLPTRAESDSAGLPDERLMQYLANHGEVAAKYAWFVGNAEQGTRPVGRLKPTDLGLFDTLGNVGEWSGDVHGPPGNESAWYIPRNFIQNRVERKKWMSALRRYSALTLGFRVARTVGPGECPAAAGPGGVAHE